MDRETALARSGYKLRARRQRNFEEIVNRSRRTFDFLSVYVACGTSVRNIDALLEVLVMSNQGLREWLYDIPKARTIITGFSPKLRDKGPP